MRKYILLLSAALFFYLGSRAQDGQLISKQLYQLPDSDIVRLESVSPGIRSVLRQVDLFRISYLSDGLKVNGYMARPKKKGTYPCVIYNRGGNREFGALNDLRAALLLAEIAHWGYVVAGSQYRGNGGSEGREEFGGREVNDILSLIPFFNHVKEADTSRIGMYGWSRGGMMTYLALTKTNRIKAAVVGAGLANALITIQKRPEMDSLVFAELVPGYQQHKEAALKERSAVYFADKICKTTPLLIMHGSADWRVSPEEGLEMLDKLYEIKHPVRFVFFEGGQHSLIEHRQAVNETARRFLDEYVRDRRPYPDMEPHGN